MSRNRSLVVLPSLAAIVQGDGRILLTQKFLSGMEQYVEGWPGPVMTILRPGAIATDNLDPTAVDPRELSFQLKVMAYDSPDFSEALATAGVVLTGTDYQQNQVVPLCRRYGTPVVVCSEYSLATRWQIAAAEVRNPLRRWRRLAWEWSQERVNRRNCRLATGLQCNGTPTYEAYRALNSHPLLYFDTRTTAAMIVEPVDLQRRCATLLRGAPLRLAFSGRLIAMKGADHLPLIARELRQLGVPFTMQILGDGALRGTIVEQLERAGLSEQVTLPGTLDFATQLTPRLQHEVDLFVCPHRQGDPSCTYLETMACGVPIVGYANEAWSGLLRLGVAGWSAKLNDVRGMAQRIAGLNRARESLVLAAAKVREFAQSHTFEQVFEQRIRHLLACTDPSGQTESLESFSVAQG